MRVPGARTASPKAVHSDRRADPHAAFEEVCHELGAAMRVAHGAADSWPLGIRGALRALLRFLQARPRVAHFLVVDSRAGDARLRARRREALAALARALESGSPPAQALTSPVPFDAQAVVDAAAAVVHACVRTRTDASLLELEGPLMAVLVMPYLDTQGARRELARS